MEKKDYEIEAPNGEDKIKISDLAEAVKKTSQWVGDNIEDIEVATIIITWLQKMNKKIYDNVVALEKLKKNEKEKNDKTCSTCKHLFFSDCYGECNKHLGIVQPWNSCSEYEKKSQEN